MNNVIEKLEKVLKTLPSGEEFDATVREIDEWIICSDNNFEKGFWLGIKNCGIGLHSIKERYHNEYKFAIGELERCEGVTRHGGMMTLGRPYFTQCEEPATVMITFKQTPAGFGHNVTEGTLPVCNTCWKKAVAEEGITIIKVEPI